MMEPQKGVPPEPSTQKVVELRNPREISRAVQYTEAELQTHLQLGTTDTESKRLLVESLTDIVRNIGLGKANHELSASIDEMLKTVSDLDQAATDLLAGAAAQIAEFAAELEVAPSATAAPKLAALSEIDAELKRRERSRETVSEIQERLEDERDQILVSIEVLSQLLRTDTADAAATKLQKHELETKLAARSTIIASLVEAVADNDCKVELLIAYKNAVALIDKGLPHDVIGEKLFDGFME